jgi:hypothetical protein
MPLLSESCVWNTSCYKPDNDGDSGIMRIVSYILIAAGLLLFANAGYDEYRGSTRAPTGKYSHSHYTIKKEYKPEEFHNAMTYHWSYASMIVIAGLIAYMIDKGQEKSDPMSPDTDENIDDELRKDEMDEELKKGEQHKRP